MSEDAQDHLSSSGEPLHEEGTAWPDTTRPENLVDPDGSHQEAAEVVGSAAVSETTHTPAPEATQKAPEQENKGKEARLRANEIEAELFRILEQKLALGRREEVLRRELSQMRQDGLVPPEPVRINPDMEIDPETGKDPYGFTAEDHAQGRYRSHGLTYQDWNDPGTYD